MAFPVPPITTSFISPPASFFDTTGLPIVFNATSSGLTWNYKFQTQSAWTAITIAAGTQGTWASGGIVNSGTTSALQGDYELGIPNAAMPQSFGQTVKHIIQGGTVGSQTMAKYPFTLVGSNVTSTGGVTVTVDNATTTRNANILQINSSTPTYTLNGTNIYMQVDSRALGGTVQTGRDIGTSVLLSVGTGTGQIALSGGNFTAGTLTLVSTVQTASSLTTLPPITSGTLTLVGTVTTLTTLPDGTLTLVKSVQTTSTLTTLPPITSGTLTLVGTVTTLTTLPDGTLTLVKSVQTTNTLTNMPAITQGTITLAQTTTNLTNLPTAPTDWLTAAAVKADAVTKIQNGLATPTNITSATGIVLSATQGNVLFQSVTASNFRVTSQLRTGSVQIDGTTTFGGSVTLQDRLNLNSVELFGNCTFGGSIYMPEGIFISNGLIVDDLEVASGNFFDSLATILANSTNSDVPTSTRATTADLIAGIDTGSAAIAAITISAGLSAEILQNVIFGSTPVAPVVTAASLLNILGTNSAATNTAILAAVGSGGGTDNGSHIVVGISTASVQSMAQSR